LIVDQNAHIANKILGIAAKAIVGILVFYFFLSILARGSWYKVLILGIE
jgi:hypothetical protein